MDQQEKDRIQPPLALGVDVGGTSTALTGGELVSTGIPKNCEYTSSSLADTLTDFSDFPESA